MKRSLLLVAILVGSTVFLLDQRSAAFQEEKTTVLYCPIGPVLPWPPYGYLFLFNYYQDANDCTDPEIIYIIGDFPYPGYCDLPNHPNCIAETIEPKRESQFTGLKSPVSLEHVHKQPCSAETNTTVFQAFKIPFASFEDANKTTRYVKVFGIMIGGKSPSGAIRIGYFAKETSEKPPADQTVKVKAKPCRGDSPPYKAYACEGTNPGDGTPRFVALLAE